MSTEQLALDPNKECTFYLQKAFFLSIVRSLLQKNVQDVLLKTIHEGRNLEMLDTIQIAVQFEPKSNIKDLPFVFDSRQ